MTFFKKRILSLFVYCTMILSCGAQSSGDGSKKQDDDMTYKYLMGVWAGNVRCVLPVMDKSEIPLVDGKIDSNEWGKSIGLAGFHLNNKGLVAGRHGFVHLATDKENLYIKVRTSTPNNDPGGGLNTKATERDGAVYSDDSVEIMINPDSEPNTVYHMIVNQAGVIFDRKCTYEPVSEDVKWNFKNLKLGSIAESGYWELEIKIPFSEIGNPKAFVKMNVARNWSGLGASALIPTKSHLDKNKMFRVDWYKQGPAIDIKELGSPDEGSWDVKVSVDNPVPNKEFIVAAMLRKVTWPKIDGKTQVVHTVEKIEKQTVPAGGKAELALNYDADKEVRYLTVVLFDPKTGEVLYSRLISCQKGASEGRHPSSAKFELPNVCAGQVFYYPGFDRAAVQMTFKSDILIESVKVFVSGKDGKKTVVDLKKDKKSYRSLIPVGSEPGEYSFGLDVKVKNAEAKIFENICKVSKRKFEWENNKFGKDKIVIPPFTPIVADGSSVEVLNRKHKLNAIGLWDSLEIKGREQLAAPMRLECVIDGKIQIWKGPAPSLKVEDNGYAASASASAKSDEGVNLECNMYFEYDGFYWVKMKLSGVENKKVERLTLMIPMKNEESPMFHAVSNTIRSNPAGNLPVGNGMLWDGSQLKRALVLGKDIIHPQLVPYIWVGGVERGLCWFLDSSMGYRLKTDAPAVRIVRNGNELRLEVDIINRTSELKDGHLFEFGMQSTPVKPLEKSWKKIVYDSSLEGINGMETAFPIYDGLLGYVYNWSKFPYMNDFSLFENMLARLRGTTQNNIYDEWFTKNGNVIKDTLKKIPEGDNYAEHNEQVRKNFYKFTFDKKKPFPAIIYKYSDPRLTFTQENEADYFRTEWWSPQPQGYFGAYRIFPAPSCLDFMIYGYYQELKHGLQGVYLDDTFIMPTDNTDTMALVDNEGQIHSNLGILAMRELVKRIAVMQHQFKYSPRLLIVHMTNALIVPCFSLATSQLSWESMFGETPLQERYSLDNIRAIDTGLQVGMDPVALGGILRQTSDAKIWEIEKQRLSRTALAMTLPHGVKIWYRWCPDDIYWPMVKKSYEIMNNFGHWKTDCIFVPYWENDPALKANSDAVIISSYRRSGACLAIISNMKKENLKFKLNVDFQKLGLNKAFKLKDAETGESLSMHEINIQPYDFKLICIENNN